jgi:hypothetical protein
MKKLGYAMITVGFLAGALATVVDKDAVRWEYFAGALVVGAAGVIVARLGRRQQAREGGRLAANMQAIEDSLSRIVDNTKRLNAQKQSINTYDVRHRIDQLLTEDLTTFVEARQSIAQVYGLQAYADIMSSFAAGERYLNRVWSASADGYIDEVDTYLEKAQSQFVESLQRIRHLQDPGYKTQDPSLES